MSYRRRISRDLLPTAGERQQPPVDGIRTRAIHVSLLSEPGTPARYPASYTDSTSLRCGERTGPYYTCVNLYPTALELAYILSNSNSKLLITSQACREAALEA